MNKIQLLISIVIASSLSVSVGADVPHQFSAGTPAIASEVNENFDDLDQRLDAVSANVTVLESTTERTQDFTGFSMPFALAGEKNVVVLKRDNLDGSSDYQVRVRYENTDGQALSIQGNDVVFAYLADYVSIHVDSNGALASIVNYREATNDPNYLAFSLQLIDYDLSTFVATRRPESEEHLVTISRSGPVSNRHVVITQRSGTQVTGNVSRMDTRLYSLGDDYRNDVLSFASRPYRAENHIRTVNNGSSIRGRIRVKGIGTVERMYGNGRMRAIYYRVNGQSDGSLADTPFDGSGQLTGLFF